MPRLAVADRLERQAAESDSDGAGNGAVVRAFVLLEAFEGEQGLTNAELADRSGLARSTVSRLTATLLHTGHLEFDAQQQRYRLGARLMRLARNYLGSRSVRRVAAPHMDALAARFRAPVALSERDGLDMVYLEYCRSDATVVVQRSVGSRVPLATSAAGRAWLAAAGEIERAMVQPRLEAAHGDRWPAVRYAQAAADVSLRTRGFVASYGDWNAEVNAVAVPLRSPIDGALVALSIAAPAQIVPASRFDEQMGPALVETVDAIRRALHAPERS